ncbi:MAG: DUF5696 domain-containing protein [Lachnospiraceae bacterium]|nr:DUF5696 domain-containing protein [Lachnospiraceae bacterium]
MKKRTIILIIALAVCLLGWLIVTKLPALKIKTGALPEKQEVAVQEAKGELQAGSGEVLAAENETRRLYLDTDTLDFRVEDKATGSSFSALKLDGGVEDKSPIQITFVGEDGTFLTWNAYDYCVDHQTFTLEQIENGFRMNLNLKETDSYRINEYIPQKISSKRYEERFLQGLEDLVSDGTLTREEADKYLSILDLVYGYSDTEDCYYNKLSTAPPISTVSQMVQLVKLLGYTTEELMEDNAEFDISVDIEETGSFIIPLEVVLSGDDLVVSINTGEIINENPYYTLTHIDILSCFGAVEPEEAEEGYVFVPDGCGALLALNHFNSSYGSYSRAVYDNTYYNDYYYLASYPETLHMPVFGMYYAGGSKGSGGFLGIIEEGEDLASITATLASKEEGGGGSAYNRVYTGVDVAKYDQVSILGPYDTSSGLFLETTGEMDINYRIRFKFFTGDTDYYDLASVYREYLMEQYGLEAHYEEQAGLYLEVTGALSVTERILGIAYSKTISMTSYSQLEEIMEDLKDYPLTVSYLGVFEGGLDHKLMNGADLVGANGSEAELDSLMETAEKNGQELFLQVDFTNIYADGNGFSAKSHASYNFDDSPIEIFGYSLATGMFTEDSISYYVLSPRYLSSVVDGFLNEAGKYSSLYVEDLANGYYADYNERNLVTPETAQMILDENLEKLSEEKTLALNNPEIDKIAYGTYAVNVSRESSGYGGFAMEIPFRQLVMNGLINYTTVDVNESGINEKYFLLQALETGSSLKFTVTAQSVDILKNTDHGEFLSREYALLKDDITELYEEYEAAFEQVQCMEIVGHRAFEEGVFETTYANGVRVITNYNMYSVTCEAGELEALGYLILQ